MSGRRTRAAAGAVNTTDEALADGARLSRTRLRDELPGEDLDWGTPQPWLRQLVEHWLHRYDWRRTEAELNVLPQVIGDVAG